MAPGGAFAVWGYDLVQVPGNEAATQVLWRMENIILGPYWSDRRKLVSGHYKGRKPTFLRDMTSTSLRDISSW